MGKDDSDIGGSLRIGPTTLGMVRISVEGEGFDIPLDFDPDEADEIAEELLAAAEIARGIAAAATRHKRGAKVRPKS
jgi:hypothetical protein